MNYLFKNEVIEYDFLDQKKENTILFLHGWGGNKNSFLQTENLLKFNHNILRITIPTITPTISVWNMFDFCCLVENILFLHNIKNPIVVCHSFGFRVACLLKKKINIKKLIVTGGAGIKKTNIFQKITRNNAKIMLKSKNFNDFYKFIASTDYQSLSNINKKTFQNVVNLNLNFALKFDCPTLLFWGKNDTETKPWIARSIMKKNRSKLIMTDGDHFTYITHSSKFNHEVLQFIKQ